MSFRFFRNAIVVLGCVCARAALAQAPEGDGTPPLLQSFLTMEQASVQEEGETQLTLSFLTSALKAADEQPGGDSAYALEIEYGLTSRLQIAVEVPVSDPPRHDGGETEISFGYSLRERGAPASVVIALATSLADPSDVGASLLAGTVLGRGELHSVFAYESKENLFELHLAAAYPFGRWRGLLEARHETRSAGVELTPGIAWRYDLLQVGVGVTMIRGEEPQFVAKISTEF